MVLLEAPSRRESTQYRPARPSPVDNDSDARIKRTETAAEDPTSMVQCPVIAGFDPLDPSFFADLGAILAALPADVPVFYAPSIDA